MSTQVHHQVPKNHSTCFLQISWIRFIKNLILFKHQIHILLLIPEEFISLPWVPVQGGSGEKQERITANASLAVCTHIPPVTIFSSTSKKSSQCFLSCMLFGNLLSVLAKHLLINRKESLKMLYCFIPIFLHTQNKENARILKKDKWRIHITSSLLVRKLRASWVKSETGPHTLTASRAKEAGGIGRWQFP